jgi:copper chaperone CopZ
MMKISMTALIAAALLAAQGFAATAGAKSSKGVLKEGSYAASVTGLMCEGCPPAVEKALKSFPGVEGVSVSQEKATVTFKIKKGAAVKLTKLQAALKAAADKMGMGADYSLRDLKRVGP